MNERMVECGVNLLAAHNNISIIVMFVTYNCPVAGHWTRLQTNCENSINWLKLHMLYKAIPFELSVHTCMSFIHRMPRMCGAINTVVNRTINIIQCIRVPPLYLLQSSFALVLTGFYF